MPYSIFRQIISQKIAELANIDVEELNNIETKQTLTLEPTKKTQEKIEMSIAIQNAISILLHHPQLVVSVENIEEVKTIKIEGIELLSELIFILKNQPNLPMAAILENWRDKEEFGMFSMLACKKPIISIENLKNEFIGIIQLLRQIEREQIIKKLLLKAASDGISNEEKQELQNLITASKNK